MDGMMMDKLGREPVFLLFGPWYGWVYLRGCVFFFICIKCLSVR